MSISLIMNSVLVLPNARICRPELVEGSVASDSQVIFCYFKMLS